VIKLTLAIMIAQFLSYLSYNVTLVTYLCLLID
jgi:hypothetical protein